MKIYQITPNGSDAAPEGPWATLEGARDGLRKLRAAGIANGPVRVELADGIYRQADVAVFGPADGNTTYAAAPGARPTIDGGRILSGWKETTHAEKRAWTLDLPEVAGGHLYFRSLFVDGIRRPRARYPKFSADRTGVENVLRIGEIRFPEKRGLMAGDHVFKPRAGDVENWPGLPDAEIVLLHYWVETRLPIPRLNPDTGWITCARRSVFNLYESFNPKFARYYIDNLFEALSDPGEWHVDANTGRVIYLPLPEETLENTCVTVPVTCQFILASGEAFNRSNGAAIGDPLGTLPVENLRFEGLIFRHADWYQPSASLSPHDTDNIREVPLGSAPQAAVHVPACVTFRWARSCHVVNCTIENTGFTAMEFGPGCRECSASHNLLHHLGGGGVKIGGSELDGPSADRTGGIKITDNTIRHVGRVFHQSCGILLTHAFACDLQHNEIAHTCYTGISVGWSWGYREAITKNIRIENNLIHDICEGVLSDNGGIYLLGVQPGTVVRGNHIYRVTAADYGGWGIYPDEGSSHVVIENNWVHDTLGTALAIHFSRELVIRNNVFARPKEGCFVSVGRGEPHIAATVLHNLFLGPAAALYSGAYAGDIRQSLYTNSNLFWFPEGRIPDCTHPDFRTDVPLRISFSEWLAAGHDLHSVIADPRADETANAFTFPPDSPALALGFRPYDWRVCGPRTSID